MCFVFCPLSRRQRHAQFLNAPFIHLRDLERYAFVLKGLPFFGVSSQVFHGKTAGRIGIKIEDFVVKPQELAEIVDVHIPVHYGGPVIFRQTRLTQGGRTFQLMKFRSMVVDAEKRGPELATSLDSRITPVGRWIRMLRIDELPQLFNILKGDMSIVGPRPERPELTEEYCRTYPEFRYRLKVKAGLTGYAQVFGRYNTLFEDKVKLDLLYIQHFSLIFDFYIMISTIKVLFMPSSTAGVDEEQ